MFSVYRDIIKNSHDEYEDEREANLAAVVVNLAIEDSNLEVPALREDTYELIYNTACGLIAQGSKGDKAILIEAEKSLEQLRKV